MGGGEGRESAVRGVPRVADAGVSEGEEAGGVMGVDACIYFRQHGDATRARQWYGWPPACVSQDIKCPDWAPSGATHEVSGLGRVYREGYERGTWPNLSSVLLCLLSDPSVERVWYGGDSDGSMDEMTPERFLELTAYFLVNGNRPWDEMVDAVNAGERVREKGI